MLVLGLLLLVFGKALRFPFIQTLDNAQLTFSGLFFESPQKSSGIALIEVPKQEFDLWQSDIHAAGRLAALLSNILNSGSPEPASPAPTTTLSNPPESQPQESAPEAARRKSAKSSTTVGIVLDGPLATDKGHVEDLLGRIAADRGNSVLAQEAQWLIERKKLLLDFLQNHNVVIGVKNIHFGGQKPLILDTEEKDGLVSFFKNVIRRGCAQCVEHLLIHKEARPTIDQYTLFASENFAQRLSYEFEDKRRYPSFLAQYHSAYETSRAGGETLRVNWTSNSHFYLDDRKFPLGGNGAIVPKHALDARVAPIIQRMTLDEGLARSAFPPSVFIVKKDDAIAIDTVSAFYSLKDRKYLFSPDWSFLLVGFTLMAITLYLYLSAAFISSYKGWCLTVFIALGLNLATQMFVLFGDIWIPFTGPVLWLLVGQTLISIWKKKHIRLESLVNRADDICIASAQELIEKKELDQAQERLLDCTTREPLLQTLYNISEVYTEQKDYGKAVKLLSSIKARAKNFRDTEQKLQVLTSMLKAVANVVDKPAANIQQEQSSLSVDMPKTLARYQIERELGRGAMGCVFLAYDPKIARRVAIKTLNYSHFDTREHHELKSRFFREAEAAGRLNHPNIISIFDVGEEENQAFIAMDFAEGKALNNFIEEETLLPVFEVYRIICDVAVALEYAHENSIVHRDIKPSNIMYNPAPYQLKVTDFGIARLIDDSKTNTGEILGSPLYMAPEQLKGKKVDRAADIFSLGVTFYQLLTGKLPYEGDNLAALTYEIIHGKHKSVRGLRKELPASASRIINQALQKDASDRYHTAAEMAVVLKKAIKRDFPVEAKNTSYI